ncbi:MAG: hypothetical protein AVDCRST_MAG93-9163 [uncultured Chloroflexia bacterium]|uniref:Uncharacterized protein n=1 Tax=uncultured Chloroflexia bacterium TaxID=1672391 RepID=A0A6J4NB09_9CHLR|nr:MAG: hypothetical protein AVDCRST_MAG93-9163 [uncultured Chloroflexia bacterium]
MDRFGEQGGLFYHTRLAWLAYRLLGIQILFIWMRRANGKEER